MASGPSLLRLDAQVVQKKEGASSAARKAGGLTAAAADKDTILDAILPAGKTTGGLRVSSTPATKTDVVALQVRAADAPCARSNFPGPLGFVTSQPRAPSPLTFAPLPRPIFPHLPLQEALDMRLQQRQARETGICPVREELYGQAFGEARTRRLLPRPPKT